MKNVSTIRLSFFLMTPLLMTPLMMICLMTSHSTLFKRHDRKIVKKYPCNDQNPNPLLEHFPLFPFEKEEELSIDMINL
jgi:hypothetical protein